MRTTRTRPLALLAAALFAAACSGGGDNGTTTPTPAITISTAAATLDLTQGGNATITVTVSRTGGFTGDVAVTVEGLPTGVTASALTIASASTSGNVTLTALTSAAVAGSNLTVRGSGSGIASKTASVALNVRAAVGAAITISTGAPTLDLTQGATAVINVTVARTGGFAGDIVVTVEGLPTGVTASALTITGANTTGSVTLTALLTAVVATGTNLTVRGSGTGVTSVTAIVALNVRAAVTGAVSVVFTPASLTIVQGATVNVTAAITRTGGFTGPVTFNVTGLPTGLTVAITQTASANQTIVTSNSANFAFTASANMAVGTSTVAITATGTGVTANTVNFVTQTTAATAGTNTLWTFCPASGLPVFVAYQDGTNGTWTRATAGAGNVYTIPISQAKGAVAYEYLSGTNNYQLNVFYGTQAELQVQGPAICANQGQTAKSVNGAVVGVGASDFAFISLGSATAQVTGALGTNTFTLPNVPNGALDLLASKTTFVINGSTFTTTLVNMVFRRGVNQPAGTTISPSIDVAANSAEAFAPVTRNLTLAGLNGEQALSSMSYVTATNSFLALYSEGTPSAATTRTVYTVPSNKQVGGDYHYLGAFAQSTFASTPASSRFVGMAFAASADKTLTFGPVPSTVVNTLLNNVAPVRPNAAIPIQPEYNKAFGAVWQQSGSNPRSVSLQYTTGYVGSATTLNAAVPDLVPAGYTASWGLQPLVSTTLSTSVAGWTATGGITGSPFVEGAIYMYGSRFLTFTP